MAKLDDYFLPYQRRWILDDSPMKLYPKSRRVGITYATSFRVNDKCLRRPNFTQWVTSRDELTAQEFVTDYIAKWAAASNVVCRGLLGDDVEVIDPTTGIRAFRVTYGNGSRIMSLSSTPEAFAGKGGDVLIDEGDLHKDSGRVIDMALPCTTWGGQLEMVSALKPDGGPDTPFCRMVEDAEHGGNPMGWSLHRTSIDDAINEGFVEKLNQKLGTCYTRTEWRAMMRGKCRNEEAWQTQYLIMPSTDGQAFLSYDLIGGCEVNLPALRTPGTGYCYGGYDVGRKKDLGVYFELEQVGDVLWQMQYKVFEKTPFRAQQDFLALRLRKNPRLVRMCIDASGLGMMLAEYLADEFGSYRVEGVTLSSQAKEVLAMQLRAAFEDVQLRIAADPAIREDLHKIKKTVTLNNNIRFEAERDDNGHSDRFWALALARHAAKTATGGPVFAAPAASTDDRGAFRMRPQEDNGDDSVKAARLGGY